MSDAETTSGRADRRVRGRLNIVDPWVPDDQVERSIVVLGRNPHGTGLSVSAECDRPLCWDDGPPTAIVVFSTRHVGSSLETDTKFAVNGALWRTEGEPYAGFTATVTLDEPIGPLDAANK